MTQPQPQIRLGRSSRDLIPHLRRFSHEAMATVFEIFIQYEDGRYARQAAEAAFGKLDRLESELSRFIENSDISQINNLAVNQPLPVALSTFECLQISKQVYLDTNGAFDITIGSLQDCRAAGQHLIKLDETEHTVEVLADSVQVDLGGIGKGYAVDRMAGLLKDWSIETAMIHGGNSSVLAIDGPQETKGWTVTLSNPGNHRRTLAQIHLKNQALSASGLQKGRHIIDPRTARPVEGKRAAWAGAATAAIADGLSTAFMVMTPTEIRQYCLRHPDTPAMIVIQEQGKGSGEILRYGHWKEKAKD